eukprot:184906_1
MSSHFDTTQDGEGTENNPKSIEAWMKKNSFNVSRDTYNKLKEEGFDTIDDLKAISLSEIVDAAKQFGIKGVDRYVLKRAREALGDMKFFVDPEEQAIIQSINLKINSFENEINNVNEKEKNLQHEKKRIEDEINTTFNTLSKTLNDRKKQLLQKINVIIDKYNQNIKQKQNNMNQSLNAIKKYKNDNDNLMNSAIKLNELPNRKLKIQSNEKQVINIIEQSNKVNATVISDKIYFVLDAKNAIQFISGLGSVSDIVVPKLKSLQYDNDNPNGIIKVGWVIDGMDENKYDDNNTKIRVEYSLIDDNENKENWMRKDFEVDSKTNERIENVEIDKVGVYIFKVKQFNKSIWSQCSNIKSITVKSVKIFDSKILKLNEGNMLMKWMNERLLNNVQNKSIKYNLLWRMTRDGKDAKTFHSKCDNKGATLTIYHSEYDHVFGGYASVSWANSGSTKKDDNVFVYLLRSQFGHNSQIYENINKQYGVYHYNTHGPCFGHAAVSYYPTTGRDMYFYPENRGFNFKGNSLCGGTSLCGGYQHCNLKECEVFQVLIV